jgi:hypothetical protein
VPLDARAVAQVLLGKMKGDEDRRRDHVFYFFQVDGRVVMRTKISHGAREIADSLVGMMARQLKLSGSEFRAYVDCSKSADEFERHLRESTS